MNTENTIKVWDIGVRLFHWSLVLLFGIAYFSQEMHELHTWSGYALLALLLFRLIWGFAGSRHARFTDFLYGPREVLRYLKGAVTGHPPHYTGHNPAGGWMITLMLATLFLISFTGLKALALEGEGPFARWEPTLISSAHAHGNETHQKKSPAVEAAPPAASSPTQSTTQAEAASNEAVQNIEEGNGEERFWSEAHALLVNLMLLFITLHVIAVILSSLLHRENLVGAMVTGVKSLPGNRDRD